MNSLIKILILSLIFCLAISSHAYASGGGSGEGLDPRKEMAPRVPKSLVKIDNTSGYWAGMLSAMIFGDIFGPLASAEQKQELAQRITKSSSAINAWLEQKQAERIESIAGELTPIIIVGDKAVAAIPKKEKRIATAAEKAKQDPKYKAELEELANKYGNVEAKETLEVLQAENKAAEKAKLQEQVLDAATKNTVINKALQKYGLNKFSF